MCIFSALQSCHPYFEHARGQSSSEGEGTFECSDLHLAKVKGKLISRSPVSIVDSVQEVHTRNQDGSIQPARCIYICQLRSGVFSLQWCPNRQEHVWIKISFKNHKAHHQNQRCKPPSISVLTRWI